MVRIKSPAMPIKYTLLNPYDIVIETATSFDSGVYKKFFLTEELERLRSPRQTKIKRYLKPTCRN